jgi:hypothetical protein
MIFVNLAVRYLTCYQIKLYPYPFLWIDLKERIEGEA